MCIQEQKLTETGPSGNSNVFVTLIRVVTLPGSKIQAWSSRGRRCRCIACNFWWKKQSAVFLSPKKKQMEIPEQREEELEEPSDGVDAVQGLDALSQLGRRVSRGAESLAEVRGGDEGDQEEGR